LFSSVWTGGDNKSARPAQAAGSGAVLLTVTGDASIVVIEMTVEQTTTQNNSAGSVDDGHGVRPHARPRFLANADDDYAKTPGHDADDKTTNGSITDRGVTNGGLERSYTYLFAALKRLFTP